ncbi:MAG: PEP/pyruvate-binding domain-containing protein [Syntrophomonadaceae bacterium]|jgi:pyruvate,water dikinase
MTKQNSADDDLLYFLKERAKELDCIYQVDELLGNQRLSWPEIFEEIVRVLPSGWQFPEFCQARIIYENQSYHTPGFFPSPLSLCSSIEVNEREVGRIEVVYTQEVPKGEEGYFLEKERKLIRTIADRIGQSILHRKMKQVMLEWNETRNTEDRGSNNEWMVIVDLLLRTDPDLLLHVCKKMINHLYWSGIKEAQDLLRELSPGWQMPFERGEVNYPSAKLPPGNIATISEKTFSLAAQHLSAVEITLRMKKWLQEQKAHFLIKAIDRIDASVGEIVDAIVRYQNIAGASNLLDHATERWLEVALMQRFLSDNLDFIRVARKYIGICSYYHIVNHLIFPEHSHGKIGGKSTGLFLAQQILKRAGQDIPLLNNIKIPKTWYITTDELTEFLHYNNLEALNQHKYNDLSEIRMDYVNIIQTMKNAKFPPGIVKSLAMALDDFGDNPLIVRSSSLLEDQMGSAFSGKYKSLFLANQGSKKQRLEDLMDAIIEVYSSVFSPDSIKYRCERGLLDFQEEMGIMIQEVVGCRIGPYYMPLFSGVGFSNNEFRWSPRIKREDGLIRLVMGLGTRAVDRLSDDFPVLISPGQPGLRVNTVPEEIKHYAPKKVDVIDLQSNSFRTIEISTLLKEYGVQIPFIQEIVSVNKNDYIGKYSLFDIDFTQDDLIVTFDGLVSDTSFVKQMGLILKTLQEKLGTPVDIEFASDGRDFYLLQCRPQSFSLDSVPAAIPQDIPEKDIVFSANRYISDGSIEDISHIVYVDPDGYNSLQELSQLINIGRAIGQLNSLLPKRRFILMGPGRWGSRGDIKMGVQVSYSDINNTAALIEIARKKSNYIPELSFGTHFFQDLVESNIRYLPLYPDNREIIFNTRFLNHSKNLLAELLPEYADLEEVIKLIDVRQNSGGRVLNITMNADLEQALGYLTQFSGHTEAGYTEAAYMEKQLQPEQDRYDDRFWRWRFYMAQRLAEKLDPNYFGVKGVYLIGSTNTGNAGPGSDIDLIIHFEGQEKQRQELLQWLEGWSLCLSEMNYLKTGYTSEGLLDVHLITDEDIANNSSFAAKIASITDPAHRLK